MLGAELVGVNIFRRLRHEKVQRGKYEIQLFYLLFVFFSHYEIDIVVILTCSQIWSCDAIPVVSTIQTLQNSISSIGNCRYFHAFATFICVEAVYKQSVGVNIFAIE